MSFDQFPIEAGQLNALVELLDTGDLTGRGAKDLLAGIQPGEDARAAAERLELISVGDTDVIRTAALETIAANPAAVADFQGGKKAAIGRLMESTIARTGWARAPRNRSRGVGRVVVEVVPCRGGQNGLRAPRFPTMKKRGTYVRARSTGPP